MASASVSLQPGIVTSRPDAPTRTTSTTRKELIARLRPFPFQYVWCMWHSKSSNTHSPTQLADKIADIGLFYRIYNNFPWERVKVRDSVHFFRTGVKPLWEDEQNLNGGCWTLKVHKEDDKALKAWQELCLMTCGGELQAAVASEGDHVLGISYSPRLYWTHISIWTKDGSNQRSIEVLQQTILMRLSPELRPKSETEYYFKRNADHQYFKNTQLSEEKNFLI